MSPHAAVVDRLLALLNRVREQLGLEPPITDVRARFADSIDSMGFVEFLALVSDDCGVPIETVEMAAGRRFGTIEDLATVLDAAGLCSGGRPSFARAVAGERVASPCPTAWLAATTACLPRRSQPASALNALLGRPSGWLEEHAGIHARGVWDDEDVLEASARTDSACLARAGLPGDAPGVLLVTSEAPPVLTGLAAALHQRLGLSSDVVALEIGGACTGFLAALWTAQRLLVDAAPVLVVAVEAPSRWLSVQPGPAGEAAALFGDAAAACVLTASAPSTAALFLRDIFLSTDGAGGSLLQVQYEPGRGATLHMDGPPLAQRAVRTMTEAVRRMSARHGLNVDGLAAVVAHGGNGRMPALLARRLGLPVERVWSETAQTGNLGSASLPIAWASRTGPIIGPVIWTAAGAGLHWGAALIDAPG
jgi:3-oxoacyl-[acyl-carrier-protein] synthase-3